MALDPEALAQEFISVYGTGAAAVPPSERSDDFDIDAAYKVEAEFVKLRAQFGHKTTGVKVGFANKAMWRVMKLETLVWAHMYDDTIHYAAENSTEFRLGHARSPKIEPEIVFKLRDSITSGDMDASSALAAVEWYAIGFEVIDSPFPDWQFKPVDFVAAYGLHRALIVGEPQPVDSSNLPSLVDALANFKLRVSKNGEFVEEGAGRNSLRSPALCLAELGGAMLKRNAALHAGDLISSGTLTAGHLVAKGETWRVDVEGLPSPSLTLRLA